MPYREVLDARGVHKFHTMEGSNRTHISYLPNTSAAGTIKEVPFFLPPRAAMFSTFDFQVSFAGIGSKFPCPNDTYDIIFYVFFHRQLMKLEFAGSR